MVYIAQFKSETKVFEKEFRIDIIGYERLVRRIIISEICDYTDHMGYELLEIKLLSD